MDPILLPPARSDQLMEALEVGLQRQSSLLAVLLRDGPDQMMHVDRGVLVGRLERGRKRAVADRPTRELELRGQEVEVDVVRLRRLARKQQRPDLAAVVGLREREVDDEVQAPDERVVDVPLE